MVLLAIPVVSADEPKAQPPEPPAAAPPAPANAMKPADRVEATSKGQLKNPYTDSNAAIVEAGYKLYMRYGCNGCHGGNGGGGMCPPLTNDVWVYGGDDDTLFRLVTLGSDALQSKGYTRIGTENVVGPMPPMGLIVRATTSCGGYSPSSVPTFTGRRRTSSASRLKRYRPIRSGLRGVCARSGILWRARRTPLTRAHCGRARSCGKSLRRKEVSGPADAGTRNARS